MLRAFFIMALFASTAIAAAPEDSKNVSESPAKENAKEPEKPKPPVVGEKVPPLTGKPLKTNEVTESGKRADDKDDQCIKSSGSPFSQHTFKASIIEEKTADVARCWLTFGDYSEVFSGIFEPTTACLHSFVVSNGGVKNRGVRGYLTCQMNGNKIAPLSLGKNPPEKRGGDTKATAPALNVDFAFERNSRSLVTASLPLDTLKYKALDGINEGLKNIPEMVSVKILEFDFPNYAPNNQSMELRVKVEANGADVITVTCDVTAHFAIPAARIDEVFVQDIGSVAACNIDGGVIAETLAAWFNIETQLSNAVHKALVDTLNTKFVKENETIQTWFINDPELTKFLFEAQIQGSYCDWRGRPGLCLRVVWPERMAVAKYEKRLLAKAPRSTGPVNLSKANDRFIAVRDFALEKQMNTVGEFKYPAGYHGGTTLEDADMTIFGGILCASGDPRGCDSIEHSFANHRFYRSPRRTGEVDGDEATFSGDQMKGVFHYFASKKATADKSYAQKKQMLSEYLEFIRDNPTDVPSGGEDSKNRGRGSFVLDSGYSSCDTYKPNFTCLLGGADWHILEILAHKYDLERKLPADLKAIKKRYAFSYDAVLWESMVTNSGYRLHLVANTIWILKRLGVRDPRFEKALKIMAVRQPENPFLRYLAVGPDREGQRITDRECKLAPNRAPGGDWAWQSADAEKKWETSMVWDCVVMYRLLGANYPQKQKPVERPRQKPVDSPQNGGRSSGVAH